MTVLKYEVVSWEGGEEGGETGTIDYHVRLAVWTNDRNDGPFTIRSALGLHVGDVYATGNEIDIFARLKSISEKQVSSSDFYHWDVELTYTSGEIYESPLSEPIKESISWDGVTRTTRTFANGNAIVNTAGSLIGDDGVEYIDNTPTITYTLNQANFPIVLAQAVRNSTNLYPWKGFAAKTVKISSMSSERLYDKRIGIYYAVNYAFSINPDGHLFQEVSSGLSERSYNTATGKVKVGVFTPGAAQGVQAQLDQYGRSYEGWLINKFDTTPFGIIPWIITGDIYPTVDYNALFPFL